MCFRTRLVGIVLAALQFASTACAAGLAPKGQKAVLEYSIEVEGKAGASNKNGEHDNWSTRRSIVVRTTLTAGQSTAQDPGVPGGPHAAAKRPDQAPRPSPAMAAMAAAVEKCGDDMACRLAATQQMRQDPQFQADLKKMQAAAASAQGPPRYQMWFADPRSQATGTLKMENLTDSLFKTGVSEFRTCRQYAELPIEKVVGSAGWPASFRFDAQTGTYAANIAIPTLRVVARTDCVERDERGRTESHEQGGQSFLPEKFQQARLEDLETYEGGADAATDGRRLAHGERVVTALYGTVMGGVSRSAKVTIRWTLTLKE